MSGPGERGPKRRATTSRRGPMAALVAVVVLVVVLFLIGQAIIRHNAIQNCLDSGRRDCDSRAANP